MNPLPEPTSRSEIGAPQHKAKTQGCLYFTGWRLLTTQAHGETKNVHRLWSSSTSCLFLVGIGKPIALRNTPSLLVLVEAIATLRVLQLETNFRPKKT